MKFAARALRARLGVAGLFALALAACGGGGGDSGTPPPPNAAITAQNQEAVARAAFVGMETGVLGGSLGIATGGGQSSALSLAAPAVRRAVLAGRKMIAAVYPDAGDCTVSGTYSGSWDDRDNSQTLSEGDSISLSFVDCVEEAGVVMNGSMGFTYTRIIPTPLDIRASITTQNLSVRETATNYLASLNGSFNVVYTEPNASTSVTRLVVPDQLAMTTQTPVFNDTVTLLDGYTVESTYDTTSPARTVTTATGAVASTDAGGFVRIATLEPLVQFDTDDYPSSGVLAATGVSGELRVTVLSATQVQIELDANDDGTFEGDETLLWTDLF